MNMNNNLVKLGQKLSPNPTNHKWPLCYTLHHNFQTIMEKKGRNLQRTGGRFSDILPNLTQISFTKMNKLIRREWGLLKMIFSSILGPSKPGAKFRVRLNAEFFIERGDAFFKSSLPSKSTLHKIAHHNT